MATVGGPILPFTSTRGAARAAVFTSDSRSSGSRTASHSLLHTYFQHKYWQKLSYPHLLIVWTIVHSNVPFQKHISVNLHFPKLQWTFTMKGNKLPSSALVDVTKITEYKAKINVKPKTWYDSIHYKYHLTSPIHEMPPVIILLGFPFRVSFPIVFSSVCYFHIRHHFMLLWSVLKSTYL